MPLTRKQVRSPAILALYTIAVSVFFAACFASAVVLAAAGGGAPQEAARTRSVKLEQLDPSARRA